MSTPTNGSTTAGNEVFDTRGAVEEHRCHFDLMAKLCKGGWLATTFILAVPWLYLTVTNQISASEGLAYTAFLGAAATLDTKFGLLWKWMNCRDTAFLLERELWQYDNKIDDYKGKQPEIRRTLLAEKCGEILSQKHATWLTNMMQLVSTQEKESRVAVSS